jgi:hypothetical protein
MEKERTLLVRDFDHLLDLMNLLDDSNGNSLEEIMNAERQDQHEASSCCLEIFIYHFQHFLSQTIFKYYSVYSKVKNKGNS